MFSVALEDIVKYWENTSLQIDGANDDICMVYPGDGDAV